MEAAHHGVTTTTMPVSRGSSQPKIRIIHIIAPEIIKTDVASFRDLVQRLTGKPTTTTNAAGASSSTNASSSPSRPLEEDGEESVTTVKRKSSPPPAETAPTSDFLVQQDEPSSKKQRKVKCEVKVEEEEGGFFGDYAGLLDCNDLWMDLNPRESFLSFLEEELQAADRDFLQLPLGPAARMDLVGEMYAS